MNLTAGKVRSPFATPLKLLLVSLVLFVVWAIGMIAFSYEPAMALRDEMGRPGRQDPAVIRGILEQFLNGRLFALGVLGGIALVLLQVSGVWLMVVAIARARRP
ncbi:hypothetical protein [Prosthecobacter sp.]|uniref:hypothetical protein n=1 Tax=Prosthecobacter sp. TaxID=1965333 RepID=UPI003783F292